MSDLGSEPVVVRNALLKDVRQIAALSKKVYGAADAYQQNIVRGQIQNFPEGMFVVAQGDRILGYCATFVIDASVALKPHSWMGITGGGYASRHDTDGD